jgi:hypothetical protein
VVRDDDGQPLAIQRYSDQLLLALLRARRPNEFRDRALIEHDVSDRPPSELTSSHPPAMMTGRRPGAGSMAAVIQLANRTPSGPVH